MADSPIFESPRPQRLLINILSLDGGGNRGYSELLILDHIMKQYKRVTQSNSVPLPCEVFDLICGTSTGGLIALMLGRLRMSVEDALKCYQDISQELFGRRGPLRPILTAEAYTGLLLGRPRYSARRLEKCIKKVVAEHGGKDTKHDGNDAEHEDKDVVAKPHDNPDAPLQDPLDHDRSNKFCRTFVVAISKAAPKEPRLLSTYRTSRHDADDCAIWEAARATTAASTYFEPIKMGKPPQTYIDGALNGADNPSMLALKAIDEGFEGCEIGCFLSIGAGDPQVPKLGTRVVSIAKPAVTLHTSCEGVDQDVYREFQRRAKRKETAEDIYFRFSVENGMTGIHLDEWNHLVDLSSITTAYMDSPRQAKATDQCVEKLRATAEMKRQVEVKNVT